MGAKTKPRSTNVAPAVLEPASIDAPGAGNKRRLGRGPIGDYEHGPEESARMGLVRAGEGGSIARPSPAAPADPASSYIARLAPGSRKTQTLAVQKVARVLAGSLANAWAGQDVDPRKFPWHQLTYQHSRAFLLRMESEVSSQGAGGKLAHTTVNRHIAALRGVLKEAWRMGLMKADQYMAAIDPLKPVKGFRLPKGRQISKAEFDAFMKVCSDDANAIPTVPKTHAGYVLDVARALRRSMAGKRDLAMFTLMCFGLRRHEVVGAKLDQYDAEAGVLVVVGKGNKEREVALSDNAQVFIDAWLKVRPAKGTSTTGHDLPSSPFLITSTEGRTITPQAVAAMLERRAKEAGIDSKSLSSHDFRRTFISNLLDAGVDIATVQKMVGHSDTSTTARYDRRGRKAAKEAANKVRWGS